MSVPAPDDPEAARRWLAGMGLRDPARGARDLRDMAARGLPKAVLATLLGRLPGLLPRCADPGMALSNLDRFVASACRLNEPTLSVLALDPRTTEALVQLLSTSQFFSELLIGDPASIVRLRAGEGRRDREAMVDDLWSELGAIENGQAQRIALRRWRYRELLRIGYDDIVRGLPLDVVTLDLSHLADACVEAAWRIADANARGRHGTPRGGDGRAAKFVVLALGKLGGEELNYSSDIDLIYVYDVEGQTDGRRHSSNAEFFTRVGGEVARLLSDHTALGSAYRVDLRLRPEGDQGPLARSLATTLGYYDKAGRTWERQALIKCRPVAGDLDLGRRFVEEITPFVYRRYLGGAEIGEIKAMKRRIEARTRSAGTEAVEVKTGHGGIRDVEFVVQFLQLLHGGAYPEVRSANTLTALGRLEAIGCLTVEERGVMEETYRFLRRVEHRLQTMFDRQTHEMPSGAEDRRTLAIRMGYQPTSPWEDRTGPSERFLRDYHAKTESNRKILDHLLHDAFRGDGSEPVEPVVDLVLDPNPTPDQVSEALRPFGFRDRAAACRSLLALAREEIEFLSQTRCRHFLAAIAPRLLAAVARTPNPDRTLTNLERVSASLGAKGMLWELFSVNPPSLRLYVDVCSSSQFVADVLTGNPGMIDDLMDSLVVDRPRSGAEIRAELAELCRGAEDLAPILLGFRNKEWVRIGARDVLGREPTRDVARELSDVAEAIVGQVARDQWRRRVGKLGLPRRADGRRACWAIVALGTFGGREMSDHSDLDLLFLFDAEGSAGATPNGQFFTEVAQRVVKALDGSLYPVDARLRPHGASGPLVTTLDAFTSYFRDRAATWERMALTRARVIYAQGTFGRDVNRAIRDLLAAPADPIRLTADVRAMRAKLDDAHDLKANRGLLDVEFLIQYLQLAHAAEHPDILQPNHWDALDALHVAGLLDAGAYRDLIAAHESFRAAEGRDRSDRDPSIDEHAVRTWFDRLVGSSARAEATT